MIFFNKEDDILKRVAWYSENKITQLPNQSNLSVSIGGTVQPDCLFNFDCRLLNTPKYLDNLT
jgi:hypothetical protein